MASGPKKGQRKPNMDEIEQAKVRTFPVFVLCRNLRGRGKAM